MRGTSARAVVESAAVEIKLKDFLGYLQENRDALTALVFTMCERLTEAEHRIEVLAHRGAEDLASLAANIPLAAFGGADRARKQPLVPLIAAGKAAVEAAVAGWYFYQMPAKEKKWCGYCITGALMNFAVFVLTLPEAKEALSALRESE